MIATFLFLVLFHTHGVRAAITVYSQRPLDFAGATYTGAAAYNPTTLVPPPLPTPNPPNRFLITLPRNGTQVSGLSIPQNGSFLGFSIEFSVINQILGLNSSYIQVPFLNLMSVLTQRGGRVNIRVGGNSQEEATLVSNLPNGTMMEKDNINSTNPTDTPRLLYTPDVFYMLNNISSLVNVKWFLGIPLYEPNNLRLGVAEYGQRILGSNLIGLQVGNEPDLYLRHGHRPNNPNYGPGDYFSEFGLVADALVKDPDIIPKRNLIGPSVATGEWTPEMVWDTGFIPTYYDVLGALAVEHYPDNNCVAQYGAVGDATDPQSIFANYLNHTAARALVGPYLNSSGIARDYGLPLLMFETNTASCSGFLGISDSFGAALWALDYALQMAYVNFSGALLHSGGRNAYYNPFTTPQGNQTSFRQWTIGPIFYANVVMAELLGSSSKSQVMDIKANGDNVFTPGYAIYDGGQLMRLALFNFMNDPSGASTYTATLAVNGDIPATMKVKYLVANSISAKKGITWAGQTFGEAYQSDGRLKGNLDVQTVQCDVSARTCQIRVPAPGLALVSLGDHSIPDDQTPAAATFATTTGTVRIHNTLSIDPSVVATSNGHSGVRSRGGSTSNEIINGAGGRWQAVPCILSTFTILVVVVSS